MRWFLRPGLLASVLLIYVGAASAEKRATFSQVVDEHFARWDKNGDGTLTVLEVEALVKDPKVTGEEAAAVAAIHNYLRSHRKTTPGVKKAYLMNPGQEGPEERRDVKSKGVHFGSNFVSFRRHIEKAPREIFATKEAPTLEGFHQGNLGDCYLLAGVAAAIHANPAAFRRMFQPRPDGSCDVLFFSGHRVHVPKLTDAEIALTSSAGEQGLWLNVIEKAFGEIKMELRKGRKSVAGDLDLDIIARGGDPRDVIHVLCGTQAKSASIRRGKGDHPPAPAEIPRLQLEIHGFLSQALPRNFLFCCSVAAGDKTKYPPGIVTNHAYAIVGYDARKQLVTVMNPWGNHFEPKGDPGMTNGYATKGGKFDVPLQEFLAIFESVSYQTAMPAKPGR